MKDAILVDIDLTFVDSGTSWFEWLRKMYGEPDYGPFHRGEDLNYDLSTYFNCNGKHHVRPFDYWEDPFLYDYLEPRKGAVECLRKLKEAGWPIRFVSYCKKGHFSSKVRMIKRYTADFLDIDNGSSGDGFYATKVKSGVLGGVIIDDRHSFLNQFGDDVIKIKFDTCYSQDVPLKTTPDLVSSNWGEIYNFLADTL